MTTTMRAMKVANANLIFSDAGQDVYAPIEIQGQKFVPSAVQQFIDSQPFSRTITGQPLKSRARHLFAPCKFVFPEDPHAIII